MNGAKSLVKTLLASGIDTCFANPGTSEMHFVAALDQVPGMKCVLGLQENVVTGMADGYYRIARKPACTLLHCGPGLANGMGNLHNARRARSGIVNIVGDQATYHRPFDAPLTADTAGMAQTVSQWVRTSVDSAQLGRDAAEAVAAARSFPGQIATLILPADVSWNEGGVVGEALPVPMPAPVDGNAIENAARTLRSHGRDTLILVAGTGVLSAAHPWLWRIAQATGATLLADFVTSHLSRGRGRLQLERTPYVMELAIKALQRFKHIILVNARPPVGFFAYPGLPSTQYAPDAQLQVLTRPDQDPLPALQALASVLNAPEVAIPDPGPRPEAATGAPTPEGLAQTVAALMPDHSIISDESVSFGRGFYKFSHAAPPNDWLHLAGGAIGDGLPVATGAAIGAQKQRRVISLQADGSAMYSLQSLWTQAREQLPCTTIILNNSKYNILIGEYANVGATPGETAMSMLDLGNPSLNWVGLANAMGVEAARATTLDQCADLMRASFGKQAPFLIELMV
ncbi:MULTISPECIES: acetolactate synthase large subunit [unclassified Bordetella]|uniref:acetolactate synthase large subunit n=1 Tax=unclassified Bordetella TaxID=2630031 RepID=UPI0013276C48|nr:MULTISPECIES: acetolactate synthase large subunit [unclassified Bordetella]MVW71648.1 acetolactate synthase large subunit [Bordetella sp. 15P40C-2]MVW80900.1 acetolactate synthase large subunit [Bordetella sp. 02P26C-1]